MNSRKKLACVVVCLVLLVGLVAGCAKSAPEPEPAPEPKFITVGISHALTGFAAPYGTPSLNAFNILADSINGAGGLDVGGEKHIIKSIVYDDKYDIRRGI